MKNKKILYLNKQYRGYDYLKYKTIIKKFDLKVIWICPFRDSDPLPFLIKNNIKYHILGFKGNRIKPWHIFLNVKLLKMMLKYGKNVDIIISSTSDPWHSKIAFLAAILLKKPIAFRKQVWYRNNSFLRDLYYLITLFIEKHSRAIFYPGIEQKKFLLSYKINPEKLYPFPRLIKDLRKEPLNIKLINDLKNSYKNKFIFLYEGRIIPRKGLDLLIESFSRLEKLYKDILLMIVGGPSKGVYQRECSVSYYKYCRELAKKKVKNIFFTGEINPSLIQNYYYLADVFVHPHRKYNSKKEITGEGWGNVVLEAASLELPLIVTDRVASAFELLENKKNGVIVNSENLEKNLFDAMKFFLDNKDKVDKFGEESRNTYERYNNPMKIINSISNILKN